MYTYLEFEYFRNLNVFYTSFRCVKCNTPLQNGYMPFSFSNCNGSLLVKQ